MLPSDQSEYFDTPTTIEIEETRGVACNGDGRNIIDKNIVGDKIRSIDPIISKFSAWYHMRIINKVYTSSSLV